MNRDEVIDKVMARLPSDVELDLPTIKVGLNRVVPPQVEFLFMTDTFHEDWATGEEVLDVAMLSHDRWLVLTTIYQDQMISETFPAKRLSRLGFRTAGATTTTTLHKPGGGEWSLAAIVESATFDELSAFLDQLQDAMAG